MTDGELGALAAGLALYGAARLGHDTYRAVRAVGRGAARCAHWVADRARSWAFARERRRVKREEGIGALNAEALRDIAGLLVETRAELARAHDPALERLAVEASTLGARGIELP